MNYYSEEEIKRVMEQYTSLNIDALLSLMKPVILPTLESTSTDRERIRMEVWRDTYTQALAMVNYNSMNYHEAANNALAAFDKQFPNV